MAAKQCGSLPIRIAGVCVSVADVCLLPYLPVFMYDAGLAPSELAVISAVTFSIAGVVQPAFTALADRMQNHRVLLMIAYITTSAIWCLLLVPLPDAPAEEVCSLWKVGTDIKPWNTTGISFTTNTMHAEKKTWVGRCFLNTTDGRFYCGFTSFADYIKDQNDSNFTGILTGNSQQAKLGYLNWKKSGAIKFLVLIKFDDYSDRTLGANDMVHSMSDNFDGEVCFIVEKCDFEQKAILIKANRLYLPKPSDDAKCILTGEWSNSTLNHSDFGIKADSDYGDAKKVQHFKCNLHWIENTDNSDYVEGHCAYSPIPIAKSSAYPAKFNRKFWIILAMYAIGYSLYVPGLNFLAAIKIVRYDRGWERLGITSFGLFSGVALEYAPKLWDYARPWSSVVLYGTFHIIASFALCFHQPPRVVIVSKTWGRIQKVLSCPPCLALYSLVLIFGTLDGIVKTYFFWYLRMLGASYLQLGVILMITFIPEFSAMRFSVRLVHAFGPPVAAHAALLTYVVMFVAVSHVVNPWWYLPIALLHRVTVVTSLGAVMYYSSRMASHLATTLDSLTSLTYGIIGRGVGGLLGGLMYEFVGAVDSFQIMAGVTLLAGAAHAVVNMACGDCRGAPSPPPRGREQVAGVERQGEDLASANGDLEMGEIHDDSQSTAEDNVQNVAQ